jgi:hypothetical protein
VISSLTDDLITVALNDLDTWIKIEKYGCEWVSSGIFPPEF